MTPIYLDILTYLTISWHFLVNFKYNFVPAYVMVDQHNRSKMSDMVNFCAIYNKKYLDNETGKKVIIIFFLKNSIFE